KRTLFTLLGQNGPKANVSRQVQCKTTCPLYPLKRHQMRHGDVRLGPIADIRRLEGNVQRCACLNATINRTSIHPWVSPLDRPLAKLCSAGDLAHAIESDPNYGLPYAWWVCSAALLPGFDVDKGLRYTKKALELDPNNGEAHRIMGSYQMWLRNFEAAKHHIGRAITLNPSDGEIRARSDAVYHFATRP